LSILPQCNLYKQHFTRSAQQILTPHHTTPHHTTPHHTIAAAAAAAVVVASFVWFTGIDKTSMVGVDSPAV
jgi:hypothetical protein